MSAVLPLLALMGRTLAATILLETALAALVWGVRTPRELLVVALAQVATNPTVELICLLVGWRPSLPLLSAPWCIMLAVELGACVVEALLYRRARLGSHPWLMSFVLNGFSFVIGLLLAL